MRGQRRGPAAAALAAYALALALSTPAQAQIRDDDPQSEVDRDRHAATAPAPNSVPPGFTLDLTTPILFSTNPELESTDIAVGGGGDWHFNPDLNLRWSHQFADFRISASADGSVDRFFSRHDADEDTLFGSVTLAWTDGRSRRFVPYLGYAVTADFAPTFHRRDDDLHDFLLGFGSSFGLGRGLAVIPAQAALAPGRLLIALDMRAGRRLADPGDLANIFVIAKLDLSYAFDRHWWIGLTPKLRLRWYDDFEGASRRDEKLSAVLKLGWTPDWLTALNRRAELDFAASFARNYSTLADAKFTDWELGPSLLLSWRF